MDHTITVRGVGRVSRRPDQATLNISVERTSPTASAAQAGTSERTSAVITVLAERGIAAADMASAAITLEPVYDYRDTGPRLTGYRSTHTLSLRLRRLDELGAVIDASIAAGANGISEVAMTIADPAAAEAEARAAAVLDARQRAETLADAAGVTLGPLVSVTETLPDRGPRPMMRLRAEAASASDTPVVEGSTEIEMEVEAVFAITD